jgi:hypothetical protein
MEDDVHPIQCVLNCPLVAHIALEKLNLPVEISWAPAGMDPGFKVIDDADFATARE